MRLLSPFLFGWIAFVAAPGFAQVSGRCYGGVCADGYTGCGCDADCCRRRLQRYSSTGSGSAPTSGGYAPEYAAYNMLLQYYQKGQQQAVVNQDQQRLLQIEQSIREEEQRQAQLARQQAEAARRQQEFDERKAQLAGQMKGDSPDLSSPLAFKNDEPAPRPAKSPRDEESARCLSSILYYLRPFAVKDEADRAHKTRFYLQSIADWEKKCGGLDAGAVIAQASTPLVGDAIAICSRLKKLADRLPLTRAELDENNELLFARRQLYLSMSEAERREYLRFPLARAMTPPIDRERTLRIGSGDIARWTGQAPAKRTEDPGMLDQAKKVWNEWTKPIREWKGVNNWVKDKTEEGRKGLARKIAELGSDGSQNEERYQE